MHRISLRAAELNELVSLRAGESIEYQIAATIQGESGRFAGATATVELTEGRLDSNVRNNVASENDFVRIWSTVRRPNSDDVRADTPIEIETPMELKASTISADSIRIIGEHSGVHGIDSIELAGRKAILHTTRAFSAGELVTVSLTKALLSADGFSITPFAWQFRIATRITRDVHYTQNPHGADSAIEFGDLDQDGDIDGVARREIWINDGTGSFARERPWGSNLTRHVNTADIDSDGDLDVILVHSLGSVGANTEFWINDGTGEFTQRESGFGTFDIWRTEFLDLDYDGDLDLIAGGEREAYRVYQNDGDGKFDVVESGLPPGRDPVLGDLDGDGDLDLLITENRRTATWINNGDLTFSSGADLGRRVNGVALLDVDRDGDLDAATNNIWINDGAGNFQLDGRSSLSILSTSQWGVADVDGDGDTDLFGSRLYLNENGVFLESHPVKFRKQSYGPVADLDGDGDVDFRSDFLVERLPGDSNQDGKVGFEDFQILACEFERQRSCRTGQDILSADFDKDGRVSFADFLVLSEHFGKRL